MNDELSLKAQEAVALYLQANKAAQCQENPNFERC
jgi:hypothetical protein